ncbi:hypothetical protein EJB05_50397, partial [Eragrostis curvula]
MHKVFVKLFEFFTAFFNHRRRDHYAKRTSLWASLATPPLCFVQLNLVVSIVAFPTTSSTPTTAGGIGIFSLPFYAQRPSSRSPLLIPPPDAAIWLALNLVHSVLATPCVPSSPTCYRVCQTRYPPRPMVIDDVTFGIVLDASPSSASGIVCGSSPSATSTTSSTTATSSMASSITATYLRFGYLDIGTKGYHLCLSYPVTTSALLPL